MLYTQHTEYTCFKWSKMILHGDMIFKCLHTHTNSHDIGWNQWDSVHKIAYYILASLQFRFIKLDLKMLRLEYLKRECVCLLCNLCCVLSSLSSFTLSANMWLTCYCVCVCVSKCVSYNTQVLHMHAYIYKIQSTHSAHIIIWWVHRVETHADKSLFSVRNHCVCVCTKRDRL